MAKVIHCRDVGFDCNGVIRADTEEEALRMAAQHAQDVHGMKKLSRKLLKRVRSVMHDDQLHAKA